MRRGFWALAAVVLLLALAGCGSAQKGSPQSGQAGQATSQPAASGQSSGGGKEKAGAKPATVAEIALYKGVDRQQILEEGAKKEGKLLLYTSAILTQSVQPMVAAFEKKYPYLKVEIFRASNDDIVKKVLPEYQNRVYQADVFETTTGGMVMLKEAKILQPYYSPEIASYPPEAGDKDGMFYPTRESYVSLGYNTKLIAPGEAPKTYQELLDPKWKGKAALSAGGSTAQRWLGGILMTFGEDMVKKLAAQDMAVQNVSGRALADMIISGEVALSPTIYDSHVANSKKKGAPIEWLPIEPVVTNVGQAALASKAPHPNAAMLFNDFLLSEDGQKIYSGTGYGSSRKGMGGTANYKKIYVEEGMTSKEFAAAMTKWDKMLEDLFIRKAK